MSCRRFTVAALAMFLLSALPPAAQAQSGPSISIDDVSKPEGDIVNGFTFTVSLSAPSSQTVTVKRATADGTAIADEGYLPLFANGPVVTFSPGQTSKQVTVDVIGDIHTEVDEDFFVNLSDAANATISDGQGRGVIQTDDMTTGAFFTTTNGDFAHFWTPPPGVTAATFRMTGARGGGLLGGSGGNFRATLTGLHRPLLICLGGRGFGDLLMGQTNFVTGGGGAAVLGGFTGAGATDVRISDDCTVNTDRRLLVAGGGGGQGGDAIFCDRRYENTGGSAPPCRLDATHFDWRCAGDPKPECVRVLGGHGGSAASLDAPGGTSATDGSPHHGGHGDLVVTAPERGRNGGELANGSGGAGRTAADFVLSPDVVPGSAGGAGTIGQTGPVGGNAGERAIADFHVGHESGALVLFPTRSGAGGGGGAGFFSGGGGGGGGVYLPVGYGNAGAGENIGITSGGGGGAGSNCMGLFAVQTCAGGATSIQSVNRVLEPNFRSDSGNGEVSIWYPDASISSPAPNTSVLQNTPVNASFTCSVGKADPQIETCSATVTKPDASTQGVASGQALPTGAVGSYTLTVTAVDDLGGTRRLERIYTVTAPQAPVNQALPTITGEPVVGQTLTASDGSWAGTGPINITHQWIRCQRFLDTADRLSCTDIPGATGSTYVVTADDRGFEEEVWVLRVRAQAQNAAGSTWSYSTVTKRVKKHPALPVGPSVVIEGALKEGETLRRNFSGPPLILSQDFDFITQWYRCLVPFGCEQITGANSRRYTLTSADIGFRIRVSLQLKSYSIGSPVAESAISTAVTVAPPSVSIDDRLEYELDADNLLYEFTVTRTGTPAGLAGAATVHYETADGSATTADNDYEQASGEVTFAPGETSKKIQVAVNGDTRFEQNENFFVNLSGPTGATITDSQAMGRIQGDETQPTISIDDVAKAEGNLGSSAYEFTVSLSSPSYQTIGVSRQSASGSASPGDSDFAELAAAPITFSPGETTKQVTVNVGGDTRLEPDEDFFVNLSDASNATIADSQGKGTIRNDDAVIPDLTAPNLAPDLTAPSLAFGASSVQSLRTALRRGIRCSLTTNEAGHLVVRAYVDRRTARRLKIKPNARRDVVVGTLERDLAHGKAVVRVKLSRKARSRMKAATRVKVRILAQITDLAGNVRSRTIRITLRRKLSN